MSESIVVETFGFGADPVCEVSKEFLGGKGYGLVTMSQVNIPVPPGLVLSPTYWTYFMKTKTNKKVVFKALLEKMPMFKEKFGYAPLVSVRSGARVSAPGMADTILNVGLHQDNLDFYKTLMPEDCVEESYARLIQMYGEIVDGLDKAVVFGERPEGMDAKTWRVNCEYSYELVTAKNFPKPKDQLLNAVEAVFKSWNNPRAKVYREIHNIPEEWGTGVVVQSMVFGNFNERSCTGVLFTRDPSTGGDLTGEFLINAQGEDVVAGLVTPQPLGEMIGWDMFSYAALVSCAGYLEKHYGDMQDIEFTVQDGELFILQTRTGKRTAKAAIKIAHDLNKEGLITPHDMLKRVTYEQYLKFKEVSIDPAFKELPTGVGLPASTGIVSGVPVFSVEDALKCNVPCILIANETTPDDIAGMYKADGILTRIGGSTSHSAVVARGLNKPCVVGCTSLEIDSENRRLTLNGLECHSKVCIDGSTGNVWFDVDVPLTSGDASQETLSLEGVCFDLGGTTPIVTTYEEALKGRCWYTPLDIVEAMSYSPLEELREFVITVMKTVKGYLDLKNCEEYETFDMWGGRKTLSLYDLVIGALGEVPVDELKCKLLVPEHSQNLMNYETSGLVLREFELESYLFCETSTAFFVGRGLTKVDKKAIQWSYQVGEGRSLVTQDDLGVDGGVDLIESPIQTVFRMLAD